jgi:hypothetical protein
MLRIAHPRQKLAIAALAIGFWSQVYLWHGVIHGPAETRVEQVRVRSPVVEPYYTSVSPLVLPPPPAPYRGCPGGPWRRPDFEDAPSPPDPQVSAAVRSAIPALRAHLGKLPELQTRVQVRLDVNAHGRVRRARVDVVSGCALPPGTSRTIKRIYERTPFPARDRAYAASFPLIMVGNPD